MNTFAKLNLFGTDIGPARDLTIITETTSISASIDLRVLITQPDVELSLNYENNNTGVRIEVFALVDSIIKYYSDVSTEETFEIKAGNTVSFVYYLGWKRFGMYEAVWN